MGSFPGQGTKIPHTKKKRKEKRKIDSHIQRQFKNENGNTFYIIIITCVLYPLLNTKYLKVILCILTILCLLKGHVLVHASGVQ